MTEFAPPSPYDRPIKEPVRPSPLSKEGPAVIDGVGPHDFADQPLQRMVSDQFPKPQIGPDRHSWLIAPMDQGVVVDRGVELVITTPKTPDVAAAVAVSHTVQVG